MVAKHDEAKEKLIRYENLTEDYGAALNTERGVNFSC
jgi:hypothetical protein